MTERTQEVVLEPCPFCGSDELSHGSAHPGYTEECNGLVQCHADGCNAIMLGTDEDDAIRQWNTRSTPQQSTQEPMPADIADALHRSLVKGSVPILGQSTQEVVERVSGDAEALDGYRAAVSFISADSWDGCSDCIEILRAARTIDTGWDWAGDPNRVAAALKRLRARAATEAPTRSAASGLDEAIEVVRFYGNAWEQAVDAEQTAAGWTGSVGGIEPTNELLADKGCRARAFLQQHGRG